MISHNLTSIDHVVRGLLLALIVMAAAAAHANAPGSSETRPADMRRNELKPVFGSLILDDAQQLAIYSNDPGAASLLREELSQIGYQASIASSVKEISREIVVIQLEDAQNDRELAGHPEGYTIDIGERNILLRAGTSPGLHRAVAALLSLTRQSTFVLDGRKAAHLPYSTVMDYPDFDFRAVHVNVTDRRELSLYRHVIREAFYHRFNAVILEIDLDLENAKHPELVDPIKTVSKKEMRSLIDLAARYQIESVPEVNSFGHQGSRLFEQHPKFKWNAPGQKTGDLVVDPFNSDARKLLFDVYEEVIDLFKPRYFHIGHDEVLALETFPPDEAARIFAKNVLVFHDFLASRGIKTMMWGDMLLNGAVVSGVQDGIHGGWLHTAGAIDLLPSDIIILDWHYKQDNPVFKSSAYFIGKGHPVIGATFEDPQTAERFASYLKKQGSRVMGMCATTWYRVPWRHLTAINEILSESEHVYWGDLLMTSRK